MAVSRTKYTYWDVRMSLSDKDGPDIQFGKAAVRGALLNLFATPYGSRAGIFLPNYGSRIHLFLHENIDAFTTTAFKMAMMEDLRVGFPIVNVDFSRTVVKGLTQGSSPGYYVYLFINSSVLVQEAFGLEFNALMR
jgi:phage baseplate assembly protein W